MSSVVSRRSGAMSTMSKAMKELVGEQEAIRVYMEKLMKSAESLAAQPGSAKERLANYRYALYDFKDAMTYHLEVDDKVFRSLFGDSYDEDPIEERREIQRLVNDLISMADSPVIEKLGNEALGQYCAGLEKAFKKICRLIELHIARENAILERVQEALN